MNIVLLEPEIPANTGNIARTCVVTGSRLHLIYPLGFVISDKMLRRSAMDYRRDLDVTYYDNFDDFVRRNNNPRIIMATTKARRVYTEISYNTDDFIMFGSEGGGIPEEILLKYSKTCVRIPMLADKRSLNLSNSAAIVLYEALRQNNFVGCEKCGNLHRHSWDEAED